jgi:hypothetical protein
MHSVGLQASGTKRSQYQEAPMMKTCVPLLVTATLSLGLSGAVTGQAKPPQVQFVQTAGSVAFKDGVLTLKDASPMTVFFSDRPERLTGQVRNDLFAGLWSEGKNSFKSDPPNAALSVFNPQGQPAQAVVVLSNPRLDGRNIHYNARVLTGAIPPAGAESTLFIDGYGAPYNSGQNNPAYSDYPCWAATAFSWGRQ